MKLRLLSIALVLGAITAVGVLRAADEAKLTCPVSGKPALAAHTVDFNGGKVQFCCENCPKAFEADSKKFAAKANLQLVQSSQLKQTACPLTGRPVAADKSVEVASVKVGLCCPNCLGKAQKVQGDELIALIFADTSKGFKK